MIIDFAKMGRMLHLPLRYEKAIDHYKISERFLSVAACIPEGGYLGIEFSANEKNTNGIVYAGQGATIKPSDANWVFRRNDIRYIENKENRKRKQGENHKKYILAPTIDDSKEPEGKSIERMSGFFSGPNDNSYGYLKEVFMILGNMHTKIQIIAFPSGEVSKAGGVVMFDIPRGIDMRIKAAVSLAFRGKMSLVELGGTEISDYQWNPLSGHAFQNLLTAFLNGYLRSADGKESESSRYFYRGEDCLDDGYYSISDDESYDEAHFAEVEECSKMSYTDQLEELIGLSDIKEQIRRIVAFARMRKAFSESGMDISKIVMNMAFVGNPGTAKTTVARIISGILYDEGLLSNPEPVEVGRADLVATYVGQTAPKVKSIFENSRGRLLFIDEAYSLLDDREGSYGDEAIDSIVQEMENHREETIVVFAGYPDKMKQFLERNQGLKSRVPFVVRFKDYSPEEMGQIVSLEADKRGFSVSENAKDKILAICEKAVQTQELGNGRFCRNLVENAILEFASREFGKTKEEAGTMNVKCELEPGDFVTNQLLDEKNKKTEIGFRG